MKPFYRVLPFFLILLGLAWAAPSQLLLLGNRDSFLLLGSAQLRYTWDPRSNTVFVPEARLAEGVVFPEPIEVEQREDGLVLRLQEAYRVSLSGDERRLQLTRLASLRAPPVTPQPTPGQGAAETPPPDERLPLKVRLTYAAPATVAAQLGQLYEGVRIVVDERQKSLLLLVNPKDKVLVEQVIRMLDAPLEQVSFEAEVLEINRQQSEALGIDYDLSLFRFGIRETDIPAPTANNPIRFGRFGRDTGQGLGISATLNLLQSSGAGRILARPRVVTTDGVEARINATQNFSVIVTNNNVQSVQTIATGITLRMLPRVGPDGTVEVQVTISVSAPTSQTQSTFTFSNREATTTVRVGNGEAIVIGGLFESRKLQSVDKVPLLGDIPVLGELFKNTSTTTSETDLVIVITPRLLSATGQ